MKVTDKRISSAKVLIKSINAELKQTFVCFFVKNTDVILLFTGEGIGEFYASVKFKRNFCTVFSVRIISRVSVVKTENLEDNPVGIFKLRMGAERFLFSVVMCVQTGPVPSGMELPQY